MRIPGIYTLGRFHGLLDIVRIAGEGMYFMRGECVFLIDRLVPRETSVRSSGLMMMFFYLFLQKPKIGAKLRIYL